MGTIWKGSISFGLVSIPVRVEPAVRERALRFHQLHQADRGRVRYRKFCEVCGKELGPEEIVRGYEYARGEFVVLSDEELARASGNPRTVEILKFVPEDQVDPVFFRVPYYLSPEPLGVKPYRLLREAMVSLGRVALARVYLREKEHPALIRVSGEALVLETLYWSDEVLKPAPAEAAGEVRPQEVQMARSLVETMTEDFLPDELRDTYRERLEALIQQKVKGLLPPPPPPEEERARVVDLMEALRASIEKARAEREARAGGRKGTRHRLVVILLLALTFQALPARGERAQWNLERVGAPQAWKVTKGAGVVVAVVDTWIDASHPDLEGRVLPPLDLVGGGRDPCWHGTHVAGIVAAQGKGVAGVAPEVRILPVRVLRYTRGVLGGGSCTGSSSDVAQGIRRAAEAGARVVNLSLGDILPIGLLRDSEVDAAVRYAHDLGALVVVAAGNEGLPFSSYDALEDSVLVGATRRDDTLASYSSRSSFVDLVAPGGEPSGQECTAEDCILSTVPGGGYAAAAGTSMAAPHVSAAAALLFSLRPSLTPDQVKAVLLSTAWQPRGGGGVPGYGRGRLDVARAVASLVGRGSSPAGRSPAAVSGPGPRPGGPAVRKGAGGRLGGCDYGEPCTAGKPESPEASPGSPRGIAGGAPEGSGSPPGGVPAAAAGGLLGAIILLGLAGLAQRGRSGKAWNLTGAGARIGAGQGRRAWPFPTGSGRSSRR